MSRSGFYAWRYRPENRWVKQNHWLLGEIVRVWHSSRKIYGSPRVLQGLQKDGIHVCKHRVERLMRDNGMTGRVVRVTRRQPGLKRFSKMVHATRCMMPLRNENQNVYDF